MANRLEYTRFYARDRKAWRAWLQKHHRSAPGVWLVYYKQGSGKPRVPYAEAVEEALCFGWVDSRPNKLDDERYMQLFTPRKPGSPWSRLNKERVERLTQAGLMAPAGLDKVERAKADGSWDLWNVVEDLTVPTDLEEALAANPAARATFESFSPSSKKNILWWIASARKPETRGKRIRETVSLAAKGLKANHYRQ